MITHTPLIGEFGHKREVTYTVTYAEIITHYLMAMDAIGTLEETYANDARIMAIDTARDGQRVVVMQHVLVLDTHTQIQMDNYDHEAQIACPYWYYAVFTLGLCDYTPGNTHLIALKSANRMRIWTRIGIMDEIIQKGGSSLIGKSNKELHQAGLSIQAIEMLNGEML